MSKNVDFKSMRGGTTRLTIAANVANDLGSLQSSLKDLAARMGHPGCFSGSDHFHIGVERDFVVNPLKELNPQPLPPSPPPAVGFSTQSLPQDPVPVINVSVPAGVLNDISKLTNVAATVLAKLGCEACCSGFDIAFRRELEHFRVDRDLKVHGVGSFG